VPNPSPSTWRSALLVSVGLHALVLAWLWHARAWEPPAEAPPSDIVLVEVDPPPPPAPAPATPTPSPPRLPVHPAPAAPKVAAPSPATASPTPLPSDLPRATPSDVPRLSPGSLSVSGTFALSLDAGVVLDDEPPTGLHAPVRPTDVVGELTRETLGRGKIDRGLVNPWFSTLGKALLKNWDADRVARGGLAGFAEQAAKNFKVSNEIWLSRAEAFGKNGSPFADNEVPGGGRRAVVNDKVLGLSPVDLEARKELGRVMREQYKATRRALIRVVQSREGTLLKVELVEPSSDATVDQEALKDVRAAAQSLPPPPPDVIGTRETLGSLWSFELIVSITPPVPTVTFEFDEVLGFVDPRLPLDKRIYKKVRLVAVE
jgi:hypothetical protein